MLSERFQCPRCEKHFGHQQILQLHLRVHESDGDSQVKTSHEAKEVAKSKAENTGQLSKKSSCMQTGNEQLQSSPSSKFVHHLISNVNFRW
jgi:hypothetical protein